MTDWHVSINNQQVGPLTETQVREKIRTGEIQPGSLIWKMGMKTWQPIESIFDNLYETKKKHQTNSSSNSNTLTRNRKRRSRRQSSSKYGFMNYPIFAYAALMTLSVTLFLFVHYSLSFTEGIMLFLLTWGGLFLLSVVSGSLLILRLWNEAELQLRQSKRVKGGHLKLISVLLGLIALGFSATFLPEASIVYRVDLARKAYDQYSIEVSAARELITINGILGPSFAKELNRKLSIHAGINTFIINSGGGLTDQALKAAKRIERIPNATVLAEEQCNSACIIILAAGNRRLADWDMEFGFHNISPITEIDPELWDLYEIGQEENDYLLNRGLPYELTFQAFENENNDLTLIPAIQLAEMGVLHALIDRNGQYVDQENAKWRIAEEQFANVDSPASGFGVVLGSIRANAPDFVQANAEELYRSIQEEDIELFQQFNQKVLGQLIPQAAIAADGPVLYDYLLSQAEQIAYLANLEQWDACFSYINGNAAEVKNLISHEALSTEYEVLSRLIRSAGAKQWQPQPIPGWAVETGNLMLEQMLNEVFGVNFDPYQSIISNQEECRFTLQMMYQILDRGVNDAPPIIRWMVTDNES